METLMNFFIFIVTIAVTYALGTILEMEHYQSIKKREEELLNLPVVTSKDLEDSSVFVDAQMVMGSVVISVDYFKRFLAMLRTLIGGRIVSYESLIDRGRREAILRMKEKARLIGADMVINMRFQTTNIGQVGLEKGSLGCCELIAYGTAVKMKSAL